MNMVMVVVDPGDGFTGGFNSVVPPCLLIAGVTFGALKFPFLCLALPLLRASANGWATSAEMFLLLLSLIVMFCLGRGCANGSNNLI